MDDLNSVFSNRIKQTNEVIEETGITFFGNNMNTAVRNEAPPLEVSDLKKRTKVVAEVNQTEVWNAFAASSYSLFDFILNYKYKQKRTMADHARLFCQLVINHSAECRITNKFATYEDLEVPVIYAK